MQLRSPESKANYPLRRFLAGTGVILAALVVADTITDGDVRAFMADTASHAVTSYTGGPDIYCTETTVHTLNSDPPQNPHLEAERAAGEGVDPNAVFDAMAKVDSNPEDDIFFGFGKCELTPPASGNLTYPIE